MMKDYGINKIYYSTASGEIESQKVGEMIPEHVSYGIMKSIEIMSDLNQYIVFGMVLLRLTIKSKTIVYDVG